MLDQLRQGAQGFVSKLLMGILVISFGIWGVAGRFTDYGAETLAWVGDEKVSIPDFQRTYRQYEQIAQQTGRPVTAEQVLDRLMLDAALQDEARQYNLGASDEHVRQQIASDPTFKGPGGAFDVQRFNAILANSGIDRDDYVDDIRNQMVRDQIGGAISAGIDPPRPLMEAVYRYQNEERTVSFIVLDQSAIDKVVPPDDAALQTYFDANKERFRAPEYRKLGLLVVDPATIADPSKVKDEDVAAEYAKRKEAFSQPERRRVEQIKFQTADAANAALKKLQGGADFAVVAKEAGGPPEDLGLKTKAEILDPKVADAAFAAQPNVPAAVTDGIEPVVFRVAEVQPATVKTLAEVSDQLKREIATRNARDQVRDFYDQIEDEKGGGATLEEIGKKLSLPYRVVDQVAADATGPDGKPVAALPSSDDLLKQAFESDVGLDNNAVRGAGDDYVFYDVLEVIPARDRTLAEVHDKVLAAWQSEETANRIQAKADALLARLQKGETLATIAADIGKPVQTVEHVKRNEPPSGLSANAAAQAFAGPEGHVADAEGSEPPARVLLHVDNVTAPAFFAEAAGMDQMKAQLAQAIRNDLLQTLNRQLLQSRNARVNNAVFAQLAGTGGGDTQ